MSVYIPEARCFWFERVHNLYNFLEPEKSYANHANHANWRHLGYTRRQYCSQWRSKSFCRLGHIKTLDSRELNWLKYRLPFFATPLIAVDQFKSLLNLCLWIIYKRLQKIIIKTYWGWSGDQNQRCRKIIPWKYEISTIKFEIFVTAFKELIKFFYESSPLT